MSWKRPNIGSRVNREVHARFWERPAVRFLRATRQTPRLHSIPSELSHQFCHTPAGAGGSAALLNLQEVEEFLRADPLDSVVANFSAHALQTQLPGVRSIAGKGLVSRSS